SFLVQQPVLVLAETVETLVRVGVEHDVAGKQVASAAAVTALRGGREVRKALGEELRPVHAKETQERRKRDEPVLAVLGHLDDEVAVGYAGPTVTDLDPGCPRFVFE